jgi:hypothetical protein
MRSTVLPYPTQIRPNAVTSAKVRDASLLAKDFKSGQLQRGPKGDKDDPGPAGTSQGPNLPSASAGLVFLFVPTGPHQTQLTLQNTESGTEWVGTLTSTDNQ